MSAGEPTDAKLTVFCERNVREVFEAIVAPTQIWQADPYDVETIHTEAREAFGRLVARASATPPPQRGRLLLLQGDAGSGKTHLMRAFRSSSHADGSAHFAYLQLTTAAQHYGQYLLSNVIASLEHPYAPPTAGGRGRRRRGCRPCCSWTRPISTCPPRASRRRRGRWNRCSSVADRPGWA